MSAFSRQYEEADRAPGQPIPIRPTLAAPGEFPYDALSPLLQGAAAAIVDKVQLPFAIAASSTLAAAALAVQAYVDVVLPTGEGVPTSLFFVTIAASGDRKSSNDKLALLAVREREADMRVEWGREQSRHVTQKAAYDGARKKALSGANKSRSQIERELEACGPEPVAPALPMLLCEEPTMPALQKLFAEAMPSLGLFSDEGGTLLGGFAMNEENRTQTGGVLSKLWDGAPIKRIRASEVATFLPGRRLSLHIMAQPRIARKLFGDADLRDQGLLSRMLPCQPASMKGERIWRDSAHQSQLDLEKFGARLSSLLRGQMPMDPETRELRPVRVPLSDEARDMWVAWHDAVEIELRKGGQFEDISGFAAKLPEHATRIAAVMSYLQNKDARPISADALSRGIKIAKFYAAEALRLFGGGSADEDTDNADAIIGWARERKLTRIGLRLTQMSGPRRGITAPALKRAITILEEFGHLKRIDGGADVQLGTTTKWQRDAFAVVADEET